jgi:hypothetical protein
LRKRKSRMLSRGRGGKEPAGGACVWPRQRGARE